ncbi:hypothetical protein GCM10010371_38980 [Streptomyces subrutilus]|uniref:Uncharacterized protein n=1 Tax=Streptomyces subrutilus TaxID=36818 RepID=A0A5P2UNH9_9ACTN|nr:hypothetical protein CP968_21045 [Streptomyces subrutilus]GGZ75398.1 hypothetical protein GCM10010371_38980 [Streptomyces subrutilus]
MRALRVSPSVPICLALAELHSIASGPAARVQFRTALDSAIVQRRADEDAFAARAVTVAGALRILLCENEERVT